MKKLISILFIALSTLVGFSDTNKIDWLFVTNFWAIASPGLTTNYVTIRPGTIGMYNGGQTILGMSSYSSGAPYGVGAGEMTFQVLTAYPDGHYCGFNFDTNLTVAKDLWVDGNILCAGYVIGATNVLNQTNIVWSTNAFYAPTNSQTTTVDMSIGYADIRIDGATTPLTFTAGTLLDDSYQTACIFVKNYPATNTVQLAVKNVPYIRGVPYVTNVSVLTVFTHNWTNDVWTNAVVLPLW